MYSISQYVPSIPLPLLHSNPPVGAAASTMSPRDRCISSPSLRRCLTLASPTATKRRATNFFINSVLSGLQAYSEAHRRTHLVPDRPSLRQPAPLPCNLLLIAFEFCFRGARARLPCSILLFLCLNNWTELRNSATKFVWWRP